jgi:hypothetical protein
MPAAPAAVAGFPIRAISFTPAGQPQPARRLGSARRKDEPVRECFVRRERAAGFHPVQPRGLRQDPSRSPCSGSYQPAAVGRIPDIQDDNLLRRASSAQAAVAGRRNPHDDRSAMENQQDHSLPMMAAGRVQPPADAQPPSRCTTYGRPGEHGLAGLPPTARRSMPSVTERNQIHPVFKTIRPAGRNSNSRCGPMLQVEGSGPAML